MVNARQGVEHIVVVPDGPDDENRTGQLLVFVARLLLRRSRLVLLDPLRPLGTRGIFPLGRSLLATEPTGDRAVLVVPKLQVAGLADDDVGSLRKSPRRESPKLSQRRSLG